jgi:HlyD family secretion protein
MPEADNAKKILPAAAPVTSNNAITAASAKTPEPQRRLHFLWQHRWFVLAACIAVALGTWEAARIIMGPAVVVDVARRGLLIETVVATGSVQTPFRVSVGSQITGTVMQVLVDEGQRVTQGQVLIELDARELAAAVAQAQGVVDQAEARMRQLRELTLPMARETLKEAQATAINAEQTFDRASKLAQRGFETRVALDAAKKDLDVARTQVRTAELQVYTAAPGGSDFVMAQTQLSQAKASLATAVSRLGYSTISAPRAGVLITRNVEQGMVVQPGMALLGLAPDGDTQILLQVDERNLGKLALGQTALVSADAYADKRFNAVLSYINPAIDITRASLQAKLTVIDPPPYLRQDMTVSVDIEVARKDNALIVPGRSVHDTLSSQPWVMGVRGGRAYKQPVHVGLQGGTEIEIVDGINEFDRIVPSNSGVLTGQRIRPVTP